MVSLVQVNCLLYGPLKATAEQISNKCGIEEQAHFTVATR